LIFSDIEVVPSCRKAPRVFQMNIRSDPRWERFVSFHPDALIYHHPGWLLALEAEYRQECVTLACEDETGQLTAVLPLLPTKGLPLRLGPVEGGRRLSSLPRTPSAGPLALNQQSEKIILEYAVEMARSTSGLQLEIKTQIPNLHGSVEGLLCVPWRPTFVFELPSAIDGKEWLDFWENLRSPRKCVSCEGCRGLRFGNAKEQHRVKWAVNKARKLALQVRDAKTEQELADWYQLYLLTMRHNAVPPRPYRFFRSLWSLFMPGGKMRLLLAEQNKSDGKRLIAGSILLQFGQTVFYAFTGCAPENWRLHPHDLLQIEAIRSACRSGFRWYDFGEVAEEHEALAQFKTKWGGAQKPLFRYYAPALTERISEGSGKLVQSTRQLWRHLPPKATEFLGDLIYSRM
jgi:Acetyltransferase (GNAT) domain